MTPRVFRKSPWPWPKSLPVVWFSEAMHELSASKFKVLTMTNQYQKIKKHLMNMSALESLKNAGNHCFKRKV
jgi:hypothetical protein